MADLMTKAPKNGRSGRVVSITKENGWGRNRTADTWIFSPLLCRLSYPAVRAPIVRRRGVFIMQQCSCRATPNAFGNALRKIYEIRHVFRAQKISKAVAHLLCL